MTAVLSRRVPRVEVPLVLSGFEQAVPPGEGSALAFAERDAQAWLEALVDHLCAGILVDCLADPPSATRFLLTADAK
jgi:hypothetical protein